MPSFSFSFFETLTRFIQLCRGGSDFRLEKNDSRRAELRDFLLQSADNCHSALCMRLRQGNNVWQFTMLRFRLQQPRKQNSKLTLTSSWATGRLANVSTFLICLDSETLSGLDRELNSLQASFTTASVLIKKRKLTDKFGLKLFLSRESRTWIIHEVIGSNKFPRFRGHKSELSTRLSFFLVFNPREAKEFFIQVACHTKVHLNLIFYGLHFTEVYLIIYFDPFLLIFLAFLICLFSFHSRSSLMFASHPFSCFSNKQLINISVFSLSYLPQIPQTKTWIVSNNKWRAQRCPPPQKKHENKSKEFREFRVDKFLCFKHRKKMEKEFLCLALDDLPFHVSSEAERKRATDVWLPWQPSVAMLMDIFIPKRRDILVRGHTCILLFTHKNKKTWQRAEIKAKDSWERNIVMMGSRLMPFFC